MSKKYTIGAAIESLLRDGLPLRFTAYDGSSAGPADSEYHLELLNERGLSYIMTAPGDLGLARAYVAGDLVLHGAHPGNPYEAFKLMMNHTKFRRPSPAEVVSIAPSDAGVRSIGHMGFFRREHRGTLWRNAADWLGVIE